MHLFTFATLHLLPLSTIIPLIRQIYNNLKHYSRQQNSFQHIIAKRSAILHFAFYILHFFSGFTPADNKTNPQKTIPGFRDSSILHFNSKLNFHL